MEGLGAHIQELYQNRLWHELGTELLKQDGQSLLNAWETIGGISLKLNQILLIQLAIKATISLDAESAQSFFDRIVIQDEQASLLSRAYRARISIAMGNVADSHKTLEEINEQVQSMSDLDNNIYSQLYKGLADVYKLKNNLELYYRYSMQYLAYTPASEVQNSQELAVELAQAVLLSETIYNIGELLEQPILSGLKGTQNEWIYDILNLVNDGKVLEFQAKLPSLPPALQSDKILQKIRIIALMERVFRSNQWELNFDQLQEILNVQQDQVEWIIMKAMGLELIRGDIDEVEQKVKINWLQPRVLDGDRIKVLAETVGTWRNTVNNVLNHLEHSTKELFE